VDSRLYAKDLGKAKDLILLELSRVLYCVGSHRLCYHVLPSISWQEIKISDIKILDNFCLAKIVKS
jgi:hypothetical protein